MTIIAIIAAYLIASMTLTFAFCFICEADPHMDSVEILASCWEIEDRRSTPKKSIALGPAIEVSWPKYDSYAILFQEIEDAGLQVAYWTADGIFFNDPADEVIEVEDSMIVEETRLDEVIEVDESMIVEKGNIVDIFPIFVISETETQAPLISKFVVEAQSQSGFLRGSDDTRDIPLLS
jgi:hypothetical protein